MQSIKKVYMIEIVVIYFFSKLWYNDSALLCPFGCKIILVGAFMVNTEINVLKFNTVGTIADVEVAFDCEQVVCSPRVAIVFESDDNDYRRVPMSVRVEGNRVIASGSYDVSCVFYKKVARTVRISFVFSDGVSIGERFDTDLVVNNVKKSKVKFFLELTNREKIKLIVGMLLNILSVPFRALPIKKNRVSFLTGRTTSPTGNLRAAYNVVKDMDDVDVHLLCHTGGAKSSIKVLLKFFYLYMTSKVVYIDDYYHLISYVTKRKGTTLVQLWHGCGAFKTFGFARFHKESVLELYSPNHRQYDIAVVSSPDVIDMYAESFGIHKDNIMPLGSPRCDALTNDEYKQSYADSFYAEFPNMKDKKILLFAPTFRGKGNGDCYYPMERFNVDDILDSLGEDWSVIVKLHPYLQEKFTCSDRNKDRFLDCTDRDVNDILIVSDFLVTDYSSVIFEASILDMPMVFYTYDLDEFVEKRDFYFDFKSFIPGPIAMDFDELIDAIKAGGDVEAVKAFKQYAFGDSLGTACQNIVILTKELLEQ